MANARRRREILETMDVDVDGYIWRRGERRAAAAAAQFNCRPFLYTRGTSALFLFSWRAYVCEGAVSFYCRASVRDCVFLDIRHVSWNYDACGGDMAWHTLNGTAPRQRREKDDFFLLNVERKRLFSLSAARIRLLCKESPTQADRDRLIRIVVLNALSLQITQINVRWFFDVSMRHRQCQSNDFNWANSRALQAAFFLPLSISRQTGDSDWERDDRWAMRLRRRIIFRGGFRRVECKRIVCSFPSKLIFY